MFSFGAKILFLISFVAFTADLASGYAAKKWSLSEEDKDAIKRARVSGDLFQQLQAVNQMIHNSQQEGCRKHNEECSWNEKDNMDCCHRMTCRCTLLGGNCRCVASIF